MCIQTSLWIYFMEFLGMNLLYSCLAIWPHKTVWLSKFMQRNKRDPSQLECHRWHSTRKDSELSSHPRNSSFEALREWPGPKARGTSPMLTASPDRTHNCPVIPSHSSHLCDSALTLSPSCWSCENSLFIPQNSIWASFAPWAFLTTHLKATCFLT